MPTIRKDIRDLTPADLQGFGAVVHLAALSNDPIGNLNGAWTTEINHQASVRLAELARDAGVKRLLFASSCIMYGTSKADVVDETMPLAPRTDYARSKALAERDLHELATDRFSPVFCRNGTVYGLSPRMRLDTVLNSLVAEALITGTVVVRIAAHLALCQAPAPTTREKGQRLEQLAIWLLPHLPGFRVRMTDFFSADYAQEIDVLVWNEQMQGGFPSFGERIIVECKNWERPVDSSDVAWFYWKMRLGGVREGILIAANGVTGEAQRRRAAQGILTAANADDPAKKIFVVTLAEIAALTSHTDLRELLIDKNLRLTGQDALP